MTLLPRTLKIARVDLRHLADAYRDIWTGHRLGHHPRSPALTGAPRSHGDPAYAPAPSTGTRSPLDIAYHASLEQIRQANLTAGQLPDTIVPAHWVTPPIVTTTPVAQLRGLLVGHGPVETYTDTRIHRTIELDDALTALHVTDLVVANIYAHQRHLNPAGISTSIEVAETITAALIDLPAHLVPKLCPDCHATIRPKDGRCYRCRNNRLAAQRFGPASRSA